MTAITSINIKPTSRWRMTFCGMSHRALRRPKRNVCHKYSANLDLKASLTKRRRPTKARARVTVGQWHSFEGVVKSRSFRAREPVFAKLKKNRRLWTLPPWRRKSPEMKRPPLPRCLRRHPLRRLTIAVVSNRKARGTLKALPSSA